MSQQQVLARSSSFRTKLCVVIVESHQSVLEHIHAALRRLRRLFDWTMIHFDSHADLACPNNVPARLCFLPRGTRNEEDLDLYDHLESTTTGIAEWILPLVLAANLKSITWVRPSAPKQSRRVISAASFRTGSHVFAVGVALPIDSDNQPVKPDSFLDLPDVARVKVNSLSPYYADDDALIDTSSGIEIATSYCPMDEMLFPQTLNLHVVEDSTLATSSPEIPWMLDVCLDYFYCVNPYWADLHTENPRFAQALKYLVLESKLYNYPDHMPPTNYEERCKQARIFRQLVTQIIRRTETDLASGGSDVVRLLIAHYDDSKAATDSIETVQSCVATMSSSFLDMAVEALPYMTLPHDEQPEVEQRLQDFAQFLERQKQVNVSPPFLITIARSVYDGFIPSFVADQVQEQLFQLLHSAYCSCARNHSYQTGNNLGTCCIDVVVDYSIDSR